MKKKILTAAAVAVALIMMLVFGISSFVALSTSGSITGSDKGHGIDERTIEESKSIKPDCILVLGCAVWLDNKPSPMLKDRLDTAIALYKKGVAPKLLLSGDNSIQEYSEPDCMYKYTLEQGVPEEDIFLDFAGFSTYESMYRAKAVFKVDSMIVVTQRYHLFRALYACDALGIKAAGVGADQKKYAGRVNREVREVLARDKDFVKCLIRPEPTFLGDELPIDGDGKITHLN